MQLRGVTATFVGYTGGRSQRPTYHNMADHTEAVKVFYDPSKISYQQLLDLFWAAHTPTSKSWGRQYRNALWTHDEEQARLAADSMAKVKAQLRRGTIHTAIERAKHFTPAEDYHQFYQQKNLLPGTFKYPSRPAVDVRQAATAQPETEPLALECGS